MRKNENQRGLSYDVLKLHDGNILISYIEEVFPREFMDFAKVLDFGAQKYGWSNWLQPNGTKASFKDMHDSMFRHLMSSKVAGLASRGDHESNEDHLLHLATRALMCYTLLQRGKYEDK